MTRSLSLISTFTSLFLVFPLAGCAVESLDEDPVTDSTSPNPAPITSDLDGASSAVSTAVQIQALTGPVAAPISDDPTLSARAAAARHGVHYTRTYEQLAQRWRQHNAAGMRLMDVDMFEDSDGSIQNFAIWAPGSASSALYRYSNKSSFLTRVETERSAGRQLVDVEIKTIGSTVWYNGVWLGTGTHAPLTQSSSWSAFESLRTQKAVQGQRLVDVELSIENNQVQYWGVWEAGSASAQHVIRGTSRSAFEDAHDQARAAGQRLRGLSGIHKSDDSQEYVGITENAGGKWAYYVYRSWSDFKAKWAELAESAYSLRDLEVITRPAGGRYYIGTWGDAPADPTGRLDTEAMAVELQSLLSGEVAGFAYAIADQSQLAIAGAGGFAQRSPDPTIAMTSRTRSTLASVTKHFTAVGLLSLLERNNRSVDSSILSYLPAAWDPLSSFNNLTFEHLLTHRSGFNQLLTETEVDGTGNGWDGLETIVEQVGAIPGATRSYKNANFALMRVLIPALRRQLEGNVIPVATEANHGELYIDWLNDLVLHRLGIEDASCETPEGEVQALSYNFDDPNQAGKFWGTPLNECGGHANLQLNAQQMAEFLTGVRYSDHVLSASSKAYMDSELAGWNDDTSVEGGIAYEHGGLYMSNGRRTETCVMRLPNGIDASLIINSDRDACNALIAAYNAAR